MTKTKYKTPRVIHVTVLKKYVAGSTREQLNDFLGKKLGYVQQQKGGFWIEHRNFRKKEFPGFFTLN